MMIRFCLQIFRKEALLSEQKLKVLHSVLEKDIPNKLLIIISDLERKLVEREELIRLILLCIFSRQHSFLIGEAGVGKTYAIEMISSSIKDGVFWEKLFNNETRAEEIIGDGISEENINNTIARADFAFFDEMFKAPQELLNSLLAVLNERKMTVNGKVINIPLNTVFSASNEFPMGSAIEPFVDRLLLWYEVKTIEKEENQIRFERGDFEKSKQLSAYFDLDDIKRVEETTSNILISDEFIKLFIDIKMKMKRMGLKCSDRKFGNGYIIKAIRTSAILNSRIEVNFSDYTLIRHFGWDNYRNRKILLEILTDVIYGNKDEIKSKLLEIERLTRRLAGKFEEKNFLFLRYQEYVKGSAFEKRLQDCKNFLNELEILEFNFKEIQRIQLKNVQIDRECEENVFVIEKLKNPFLYRDIDLLMNNLESSFMLHKRPVKKFLEKTKDATDYHLKQHRLENNIEDEEDWEEE